LAELIRPMFDFETCCRRMEKLRAGRHRRWYLDGARVKSSEVTPGRWHAVHHEGGVPASFVTQARDRRAALGSPKKAMKRRSRPEVIATGRLRTYSAALNDLSRGDHRAEWRGLFAA
jgi:putative transposase